MQGPLFELRDAVVTREGRPILSIANFVVREGEHLAVLGPNGAGKSTLVRVLARDVLPLAHDDGSPAVLMRGRERWGLFEARALFGVVSEALGESYRRPVSALDAVVSGFFGSVGLYRHQTVEPRMRAKAEELLALLGADALAGRRMDTLSTGEARRVLIARALVHDPPVLVLDEPCDGLDPGATLDFLRTVRGIAASGRTLVLVTHHIEDIVPEISRVVMLRDGEVLRDGLKAELLADEALSALYGQAVHVEQRGGAYRLWGA